MADVPVAFLAGLLSIITPCVLPLVPGYLSAVSAVEADRLGEAGVGRRVAKASIPFVLGFSVVFVVLGAGAGAPGGVFAPKRRA
jgi:cytochrome c-type biogenesis protein